jgi:hypothetical protein
MASPAPHIDAGTARFKKKKNNTIMGKSKLLKSKLFLGAALLPVLYSPFYSPGSGGAIGSVNVLAKKLKFTKLSEILIKWKKKLSEMSIKWKKKLSEMSIKWKKKLGKLLIK